MANNSLGSTFNSRNRGFRIALLWCVNHLILRDSGRNSALGRIRCSRGFTLIELLAVVVIIGILAGLAIPKMTYIVDKAKTTRAIGDVKALQTELMAIEAGGQPLPADLAEIGRGGMLDPWGNPYVYAPFPPGPGKPGGARKDKFLVPVNSTFDLYSMGPDGASAPPFTASQAQDDIVRANDGGYVGIARNF
jgi:general secretion pathway protein G